MALIDKENLKANIIKMLGISGEEYLLPAERAIWNVINAEQTQEIIHCTDCLYKEICSWKRQGAKFCSYGVRGKADGQRNSITGMEADAK